MEIWPDLPPLQDLTPICHLYNLEAAVPAFRNLACPLFWPPCYPRHPPYAGPSKLSLGLSLLLLNFSYSYRLALENLLAYTGSPRAAARQFLKPFWPAWQQLDDSIKPA